jgi:hypothetical protein
VFGNLNSEYILNEGGSLDKILISEAIQGGNWYDCQYERNDEQVHFKLRILAFRKTSVQEIKPDSDEHTEGVLWIMEIEVVSLNKRPLEAYKVRRSIELEDHEEFVFEVFTEGKLDSDEKSGLHRFSSWSSNPSLSPKIKAWGSILFRLPEEDAQYSLVIKNGSVIAA